MKHWQFPKKFVIFVLAVAKLKNIVVFAFTYVLPRVLPSFNMISAWIYIVLTAMKQGNEACNASPLHFLIKR
jgi:hypothetical protein